MDDKCRVCGECFPQHLENKSYNRTSVRALSSPHTFSKVFPYATGNDVTDSVTANQVHGAKKGHQETGFLCAPCVNKMKARTVQVKGRNGRQSVKRKWIGSPKKTPSKRTQPGTPSKRPAAYTPSKRPPPYTPSKRTPAKNKVYKASTPFHPSPYKASCQFRPSPFSPSRDSLYQPSSPRTSSPMRDDSGYLGDISASFVRPPRKETKGSDYGPGPDFTMTSCAHIKKYHYVQAFRLLSEASLPAKKAMLKVVGDIINSEKKDIKKSSTPFNQQLTLDVVKEFNWGQAIEKVEEVAPVTVSLLKDMFPAAKNIRGYRTVGSKKDKRAQTVAEAETTLTARVGSALSLILFTNQPKTFKTIPAAVGVELWRQSTSQKAFASLNAMGVTQSSSAARGHVDRLGAGHDTQMIEWKSKVEAAEHVVHPGKKKAPRLSLQKKLDCSSLGQNCSYAVCWDNVQIEAHASHQGFEKLNAFMMWGMTFGVSHRVPSLHLSRDDNIAAIKVPMSSYVPSVAEQEELRQHMQHIVVQVLAHNLDCLSHLHFEKHRRHAQTDAMNQKTEVVNLGVVEANPSSTEGCITIMEYLYKYVANTLLDKVILMLCSGDGMTVERMKHAHLGRANGRTHEDRLEGLVETPQEFHKEILLLQDYMNIFFKGDSIGTRGTLSQLKAEFKHRSLEKDVKNNVAQVWDMLQFSTDAYITSCGIKLRGMTGIDDLPESFPVESSTEVQKQWVQNLAAEIVDFCWLATDAQDVGAITHGLRSKRAGKTGNPKDVFPFCCLEDKEEDTVRCCSWLCERVWFHPSCANLQALPHDDEDWYCTPECAASSTYVYCFCHERKGDTMVECALQQKCTKHQWYHVNCIETEGLEGTWYCSEECTLGALEDDPVLNHTKALMWAGLNNLVRREAVRDGNGPEMLSHWKMDMQKFWSFSHPKYFIIAHQLLTNVGGFMPEHIRNDLIWNRVGNLKGSVSGNVGLDLINEFLNNDFKELLKHSRGRYTDKQVARCAQMSGAFGRFLDRLFTLSGLGQYDARPTYTKRDHYKEDIRKFCDEYTEDALFDYIPGRTPEGFEDFTFNRNIRSPMKMGEKIHELSLQMDGQKRVGRRR